MSDSVAASAATVSVEAESKQRALRTVLGRFATGVAVVTAVAPNGKPIGLTVNSFTSVSLDPPLVLWCLGNEAADFESFCQASHHCINVLAANQQSLSNHFAQRTGERFAGIDWAPGLGAAPKLTGSVATIEVRNRIQHAGGDHQIFIGEVESFSYDPELSPLVFWGGRYQRLAST